MMDLMFRLPGFVIRRDDLMQERRAPPARVANAARNARQIRLQRRPDGIRKHDRGVELLPDFSRDRKNRVGGFNSDHFIDLRDQFPKIRKLALREHRDVRIWAARLDRADCGHRHHRVAEPVARADENAKWLQFGGGHVGWNTNTALVARKQKLRFRRFPAVVNPEPILRRAADLRLERFVDLRRQQRRIARFGHHGLRENHLPFADSRRVKRGGKDAEPVRSASVAASGDVDASRPNSGHQTPASPAC